jgi:hypothetical protein
MVGPMLVCQIDSLPDDLRICSVRSRWSFSASAEATMTVCEEFS